MGWRDQHQNLDKSETTKKSTERLKKNHNSTRDGAEGNGIGDSVIFGAQNLISYKYKGLIFGGGEQINTHPSHGSCAHILRYRYIN